VNPKVERFEEVLVLGVREVTRERVEEHGRERQPDEPRASFAPAPRLGEDASSRRLRLGSSSSDGFVLGAVDPDPGSIGSAGSVVRSFGRATPQRRPAAGAEEPPAFGRELGRWKAREAESAKRSLPAFRARWCVLGGRLGELHAEGYATAASRALRRGLRGALSAC
jgi:hypothetical protein